jgi:hypothetical protein
MGNVVRHHERIVYRSEMASLKLESDVENACWRREFEAEKEGLRTACDAEGEIDE